MRRLFLFFVIAIPLLISCKRDFAADRESPLSIRVGMATSLTKVAPGPETEGNLSVLWQLGDRISLNGAVSNALTASFAGRSEVAFSFAGFSASAPYNLLYPGTSESAKVSITGSVPPMYATGSDLSGVFTFHHLGAAVRLKLTGDLQVSSLSMEAPGGENISGTFSLGLSTGVFNGSITAYSASSSLTVDYDTPVDLTDGEEHDFFLYFAPGTFTEGLIITAEDVSGATRCWLFASGKSLAAGNIYLLPPTTFSSLDLADGAGCALEDLTEETMTFEL